MDDDSGESMEPAVQQSIYISYPYPAGTTAANPPHAAAADEWDGQTDGHSTVSWTLLRILCRQYQ